ncbi:MAG TPA: type IV secretion system DNA-binding domain-containing protein [Fimbriimonadaceae bacterium]|nr:type IV secretion system DNA-binding domain-containing protein [Fimbriimonadaceae bacterium]
MNGLAGLIERMLLSVADTAAVRLHAKQPVEPDVTDAIGFGLETNQPVRISPDERRKHLYVLGATGSGKTNFLLRLIDGDLEAGRSLIVIDLRGDLTDRILLRLASGEDADSVARKLCLLDLRNQPSALGFNPLVGPGEPQSRAFHLLGVIRSQAESWGVQLEETIRSCLVALAETGGSLLDIEALLTDARFRASVLSRCRDPYVLSFFARYDALSADRQSTWLLPVLNKITPLLSSPAVRSFLSQEQTVDLRRLMDTPGQVVLISLAVDRLHSAAYLLGGLLVSTIQSAAMARVDQPEQKRNPVNLYIDEFETMASPSFEAIIAEGRRFGLSLTLSHQNLSQVPAGLRQVLRNNVHTQLLFQTGALDAGELASEITGLGGKEEARTILMTQAIGQAILIRRGQPAVRIRTLPITDPVVSREAGSALKEATKPKPAPEAKPETVSSPEPNPTKEVRHGKRPGSL